MARWIDTSGRLPSFKTGAAVTGVLGTFAVAWQAAFIENAEDVFGGVWSTLDGVRSFLANPGGLYPSIFSIPEQFMATVAAENAAWLASLGVFGWPVAFVEGITVFAVLGLTARTLVRKVSSAL